MDQRLLSLLISFLDFVPPNEIWEIGAGTGALTNHLLGKTKQVRAFEIDVRFKPILENLQKSHPGLIIHWGDFLDWDIGTIPPTGSYSICGNLPYYCATPIIRKCLDLFPCPSKLVFLVQKEVSQKIVAKPDSEHYGFLSVDVQLFGVPKIEKTFSPSSFYPNPQVFSSILTIKPLSLSQNEKQERARAIRIASLLFSHRRKMAVPLLKKAFPNIQPSWEDRFSKLGLPMTCRPENISPEAFISLSRDEKNNPERQL